MSLEPPRLTLARLPTPIERVLPTGFAHSIRIKRDDLTGSALSGNKIRKLEYLLAEAKAQGKTRVLTCGGIQSNHCRATAVAAARVGLTSLLFLRTDAPPEDPAGWTGNLRLDRIVGAEVRFVTRAQYLDRAQIMARAAGPDDAIVPEGGSNALGAWGYIRAIDELIAQWESPPTSIVVAVGSGGTLAGLVIGAKRRGLEVPIHGVAVCDDAATFQRTVGQISQEASMRWPDLPLVDAADVSVIEGYVGRGYALTTPQEEADLCDLAQSTGLILDPVYSNKAFRALRREPERFGSDPLFIHTGGIFGLLA
ncbi:MAG: D-cysteine desulfhydrase [Myxococcota bacterium]|jgi:D-cysteine desulfhydrase